MANVNDAKAIADAALVSHYQQQAMTAAVRVRESLLDTLNKIDRHLANGTLSPSQRAERIQQEVLWNVWNSKMTDMQSTAVAAEVVFTRING